MKFEKGKKYQCTIGCHGSAPFLLIGKEYECLGFSGDGDPLFKGEDRTISEYSAHWFEDIGQRPEAGSLLERVGELETSNLALLRMIVEVQEALTVHVCGKPTEPKDYTIYVPDGILSYYGSIRNGEHYLRHIAGTWVVGHDKLTEPSRPKQFKLVPVLREELKPGDAAFVCHMEDVLNPSNLECYAIVTNEGITFWDEGGVAVCNYELNTDHVWYKVVEA